MTHVVDDLELYALDALPAADRTRISAHLAECPACREQARVLEEVAIALPETLPLQDVPSRLRARILASAGAELAAPRTRRGTALTSWLNPTRFAIAGLAVAVLVLGATDLAMVRQRDAALGQRDQYADIVTRASHGGKSWYMAGVDQWAGSGGTLYAPAKPGMSPYVVFHDLRPIERGTTYALWLIDNDGHWYRAANFTPNGDHAQAVILDEGLAGYTQCALTVETAPEGRRAGPIVMQSRIVPPQTQ